MPHLTTLILATAALLSCLTLVSSAAADCLLSFVPVEDAKYLLKADGCREVSAITVTVDYDTTFLAEPEVGVMGGRLLDGEDPAKPSTPGTLQLRLLNEERNAALEATIYFRQGGERSGIINFVSAELSDLSGEQRQAAVQMVAPVNDPQQAEPAAEGATAEVEAGPPGEGSEAAEAPAGGGAVATVGPAQAVFERFRDFSGAKSLAAFRGLFAQSDPCCRQTPAVALADGAGTVQVVIVGVEQGSSEPSVRVKGGRLLSVRRIGEEEWQVLVQPEAKWWDVRLSAVFANAQVEFPLTVAPSVEVPRRQLAKIDEKSFLPALKRFLAATEGQGGSGYPVWQREYLFAANLLAAQGAPQERRPVGISRRRPGARR